MGHKEPIKPTDPFVNWVVAPLSEPLTRREREILGFLEQGLTSREIAGKLTIALSTTKWHIQHIYAKLGVNNCRQAIARARELGLLGAIFPALQTAVPSTRKHNLPLQLTSFIGRDKEIGEVSQLVYNHRLVTLTGPGGSGKTRLSIRVAQEVLESFHDGVWFTELAPISDPELVPQVVANTLGLRDLSTRPVLETVISFLQGRQALVVLDNCEHLIDACAWLADMLLRACPMVSVLASSREGLGVAGEMVFHVPSMDFPDPHQLPALDVFDQYEATHLFIERARAVLPSFQVTGRNAQAIALVCQRLDGIPLAIELAAARVSLLRVEQIASRLDESFSLLVNSNRPTLPRHQTLRATIDWSYQLLAEKERLLLHRLAVFAGGCTLEAAEAVCTGERLGASEILDLLASLVNRSMVMAERQQGYETRYRLLETVRQYAHEMLENSGERRLLRNRHLDYFLDLVNTAVQGLHKSERGSWVLRLNADMDNLRSAIDWAYTEGSRPEDGLYLATELGRWLWAVNGPFKEAELWLTLGLAAVKARSEKLQLQARSYGVLGWLALNAADWSASCKWYAECIRLCQEIGQAADAELSWALWGLAYNHGFGSHDATAARRLVEESVGVARRLGSSTTEQVYLAFALSYKARILTFFYQEGDLATIRQTAQEVLRNLQETGSLYRGFCYWVLGKIAERQGEFDRAYQYYHEVLTFSRDQQANTAIANTHRLLSWLFFRQADYARALDYSQQYLNAWFVMGNLQRPIAGLIDCGIFLASFSNGLASADQVRYLHQAGVLFSAAQKSVGDHPIPIFPEENYDFTEQVEQLRGRLDAAEFHKAWEEGQAMSLDEAVKFVLSIAFEDG